jgi:hypothetical protein
MPFGISFHSSGIHPGSFHLAEAHPVEESHPSGSKPAGNDIEKPGSPAVASGHDPFPPSSTGLPSGSSPVKSVLHDIKLPDDPSHYVIKTPDKNGDYELFKRDEATDTPIDTGQKMRFGGQGGWEKVSNPDVAKPATSPTLPPVAKIGADDLGELNGEGLFPDGKGNQFGRIGEKLYQMKYDHQLEGHRAVDPKKPNTFQGSVPVKLDGKGGAGTLPKAGIKGGMDPADARESVEEGLRVRETKATWATAIAKHSKLALQADSAVHDFHRAGESLKNAEDKQAGWQRSRDRESDPARRKGLQAEVHRATNNKSNAKRTYREAHDRMRSLESQVEEASRDQRSAFDGYRSALEDGYKAMAVPRSSKRLP